MKLVLAFILAAILLFGQRATPVYADDAGITPTSFFYWLDLIPEAIDKVVNSIIPKWQVIFMAKVKIYSTTTCPYCKMLKAYLAEKNISYEDVLVDQNPNQMQTFIDTCGSMGVPCTHITKDDGTEVKILGFDKEKIDLSLEIS